MRVWALGLSCETPAASGPPGLHTTARELQTCTFQAPALQKTHQNSTRRHPGREERKLWWERKKKREILAPHPSGPPPFGPPTLRTPHFFWVWVPTLGAPPFSTLPAHTIGPPTPPFCLVKDCCGIRRTLQHAPAQQTKNKSEKRNLNN